MTAAEVSFRDLVTVDDGSGSQGIYWGRVLVGRDNVQVAILTDVPGNPGPPAGWAAGLLADRAVSRRIDGCRRVAWCVSEDPRLTADTVEETFTVLRDGAARGMAVGARFRTRRLQRLLGVGVPALPPPWELDLLVRRAGGRRPVLTAPPLRLGLLDPADLPEFAGMAGCPYRKGRNGVWPLPAGTCPYFAVDWCRVASASVAILRRLGPEPGGQELATAVSTAAVGGAAERWALESLFTDPIAMLAGRYLNGQCRGCPLRVSGAAAVVAALC